MILSNVFKFNVSLFYHRSHVSSNGLLCNENSELFNDYGKYVNDDSLNRRSLLEIQLLGHSKGS